MNALIRCRQPTLKAVLIVFIIFISASVWFIDMQFYLSDDMKSSFNYYLSSQNGSSLSMLNSWFKTTPMPTETIVRNISILCLVLTNPNSYTTKAKAVNETWGKRCDHLHFISTKSEIDEVGLPIIYSQAEETYSNLWAKTKEGFHYAYEHLIDKVDFVLKADDDTYVVMENMKYMLSMHDPNAPLYLGAHFGYIIKNGYHSGGAGYILSREAVKLLGKKGLTNDTICRGEQDGTEDVEMGTCMQNLGVNIVDSRDKEEEERFIPVNLETVFFAERTWLDDYMKYKPKHGFDCCSKAAISFHYIGHQQMYIFEYLIYKLRTDLILNPEIVKEAIKNATTTVMPAQN